ncbi:M14 family metallopeptidase [Paenibacillus sp. 481]|uniref:M14 family metallopeptidase n=1 Tax=Paenibacillus sp. 481 TaxID=2835869 RepID=UPI001E3FFB4B|nr:M14 family metallopeptidase [Paenibacillus sp. 481]UHA72561.1 LysM peptidoglycan-binding domain-containing protein [Paenibacillus sp. 481]
MTIPYVVQKGDTYLRICLRYGIHIHALLACNTQISSDDYAVPGQVIYIPQRQANIYVVQPCDTFYAIALRFHVPAQVLANANPTIDPRSLVVGQSLTIPYVFNDDDVKKKAEYGYMQLIRDVERLKQCCPIVRTETIGYSVLGKPIVAIALGNGPIAIHANGAVHANEWVTSALLMKFAEDYAQAYEGGSSHQQWNVQDSFARTTLWIVPMANPDGVELAQEGITPQHPYYKQLNVWNGGSRRFQRWKANVNGVDLNDQFPAHWEEEQARRGRTGPGPLNFGGQRPLSEPEAIALASFTDRIPFALALSFHTQGQEIYWNYRDYEPAESERWAERFQLASGYRAVKLSGSDAGYKDWFIQQYRKPGFTIEVGNGISPLPLMDFDSMYREVSAILIEAISGTGVG